MPFVTEWLEPEVLVDGPERKIQIRRAYDMEQADDPLFWHFTVSAGEHYGNVDSDWENGAWHYDVRDLPGYGPSAEEPTVLDSRVQAFLRSQIELGHITAEWDK